MGHFWDDDDLLEAAKKLLAESHEDLQARAVAQALRLQQEAEKHLEEMTAAARAQPPRVAAIANLLEKHPGLVEPVTQLLEKSLQAAIAELEEEAKEDDSGED